MIGGTLEAASRRSTYIETFEAVDDETGDPIDFTGADISVELRGMGQSYAPSIPSDYGFVALCPPALTASLGDGVTLPDDGIIQWQLDLSGLSPGPYRLSVIVSRDGFSAEIVNAILPVED